MVVLCANVFCLPLSNVKPYSGTNGGKAIPNADSCKEPCLPKHEYGLCRPNEANETGILPTDCRSAHGWNVSIGLYPYPIRQYLRIVRRA